MPITLDYHVHTHLCKHATGDPMAYVRQAAEVGLREIGFSDHCPWPDGFDYRNRMRPDQFECYKEIVAKAKDNPFGVTVRYGLEVDWVPGRMDEVFDSLREEPLDYLIGSVHYTDNFAIDDPASIDEWKQEGVAERAWLRYAEVVAEMIRSGRFNIIGHLDLPKKFGFYPASLEPFHERIDSAFINAAATGMAVEINTSGLRKPVKETYPSLAILRMANRRGVALTFGSDSHSPGDVGKNFTEAGALAAAAGFTSYVGFDRRQPVSHALK